MRYGVLGPLEVWDGARRVPLPQGRQRLLLAVLLLNANQTLSTDRLIDMLWGEAAPTSAARSVHNLVSGLRKVLVDGELVTRGRGYELQVGEGQLDAQRFDELAQLGRAALKDGDAEEAAALLGEALAIWRGPPLADLAYEPAVQGDAARLEDQRLVALEDRIDADLALGRHAELTAELEVLCGRHALRERMRGQQMVALYRAGRQVDALGVYQDVRRGLVEQLGLDPGPALRQLERAILEQDPSLGVPDALPPPPRRGAPLRRHPWRLAVAGALLLVAASGAFLIADGSNEPHAGAAAVSGDVLVAIDPATNRVVAEAPVGATPNRVAFGAGAAWALNADDATVSRVDVETNTVRTFSTGAAPLDLAAGGGALWVVQTRKPRKAAAVDLLNAPSSLTRIDPFSGTVRATSSLPVPAHATIGVYGQLVAVGGGAAWVLGRPGWVHRIDIASGRIRTLRSLDAAGVAVGDGQVWLRDMSGRLVRLDPGSGRAMARIPLPSDNIRAMAVGGGAVWLADPVAGAVWRVASDPLDARTIAVGPGVDSVAADTGSVWVASSETGTVTRIDMRTARVVARIPVGPTPRSLAVGGGRVWVAVTGGGRGAPPAPGLRAGERIKALTTPPCGRVVTGGDGRADLLIASDLPLRSQSLRTTLPMSQAVEFVLREHRFRAGRFRLGYQPCDDATAQYGTADWAKCRDNAGAYARNPAVIGVIGPLNSDCAERAIPVLNRAPGGPLSLVSPTNSDPGLVRPDSITHADPRPLYPKGQRGYARLYPSDDYEAAAGAILAKRLGHGSVFLLEDGVSTNGWWSDWFRRAARRIGLRIAATATWNGRAGSARPVAERVRASGTRAVYVRSSFQFDLGELLRDLRVVLGPDVAIIGPSSFLSVADLFTQTGPAARGIYILSPGLPRERLDAAGRQFVRGFGATQAGHHVSDWDVYTAAATEVLLDAIARSDGTRASVARALATTRLKDSPLGPVSLGHDGELTASPVSVVRAERGGGDTDILSLDGGEVVDVIVPPARLVGG
jgi:YVTN family beta-propeller protein